MIDLTSVFNSAEKFNIEVKAAQGGIPSSIWETYSSFANTFGGNIILGIGEDETTKEFIAIGLNDPDKILKDIWNALNNPQKINANILLERNVYVQEYEGKNYVIIEVPRANRQDKPIFVGTDMFKGTYRRNHEGDYRCTKDEIKAMLRDQSDTSSDALLLEDLELSVLNEDSVKSYRNRFNIIKPDHVWNSLPNDEFLIKIGAAKNSVNDGKIHPTLGGLIFFGNFMDIVDELPNFFLDYRQKMSTETRWTDRICSSDGDWSGNIYDFYFKVIDRLTSDVPKPFKINSELLRDDDTPVHKALREAFANALIHADYYGRQGIVIEKDFKNIKISNPGTFRINIKDAIAGGVSDARNSRIFNMFSLIRVGERSGMGLCDLFNIWKESGYTDPVIEEKIEPDRITLFLNIRDVGEVGSSTTHGANIGVNKENGVNIGANEEMILKFIAQNPTASSREISDALPIPLRSVQRYLTKLQKAEIIDNDGDRKNVKWIILK